MNTIHSLLSITFLACVLTGGQIAAEESSEAETARMNVAVLTLRNADGVTAGEAEIISDRLRAELFNTGRVNMMERSEMKQILAEQGFQQSGAVCTDEQCMVEMGKILGVQQIVAGSIGKVGSLYLVNLRVIDVKTGKVVRVISKDLNGMDVIVTHLPGISEELMNPKDKKSAQEKKKSVAGAEPAAEQPPAATQEPVVTQAPPRPPRQNAVSENWQPRFGIRLGCDLIPGETNLKLTDRNPAILLNDAFTTIASGSITQPNLTGILCISRYFSVEAGMGYGMWQQEFTYTPGTTARYTLTENYTMLSIVGGATAALPVSMMRFKLGLRAGYAMLNNTETSAMVDVLGQTTADKYYLVRANAAALWFGGKAGIEILPSPNIGINFDGLFHQAVFPSASLEYDPVNAAPAPQRESMTIELPALGVTLGVSLYF